MSESKLLNVVRARQMCLNGEARRIRVEAGLTMAEVAALVGTDKSTIARWESGERRPRFGPAAAYEETLSYVKSLPKPEPRVLAPKSRSLRVRAVPNDPVIEWLRSLTPMEIRRIYRRAGKYRDWVAKQIPASEMTVRAWEQGKISNGAGCRRFGELLMELEDDWSVAYYRRCLDAVAECSA